MVNCHKTGPDFAVVSTMTASGQRGRLIKAGVYPGHFGKSLCVFQKPWIDLKNEPKQQRKTYTKITGIHENFCCL